MGRLLIIALLLIAQSVHAASWYVDSEATGANNGTNWVNAWSNPTNVVWASVNPGDTVFVSGGATSKLYTNDLTIGKNGTAGNPITVKIGQDPGHNGVAIFTNAAIRPNGPRPQWNVIDGSRDPTFVAPTNHQQVGLDLNGNTQATTITNNIGFRIINLFGTNLVSVSPLVWYLRKPDNCTFRWIEVSGLTNTHGEDYDLLHGAVANIDQGDEIAPATNTVWEYCYLFGNIGGQFVGGSGAYSGASFDEMVFRFLWLDQNGEDHFKLGGGVTVRDCVIGPIFTNGVHNDYFQFTGNHIKVYNNDIRESQNSIMRIQTSAGGAGTSLRHSVWFFNNLVTEKQGRAPGGGTLTEPFCMVHFDSQSPTHLTVWSNIVFANNLFYNSVLSTVLDPDEMCRNPVMYWSRGAQVTNSQVVASMFVNNLMVMKHKGISFPTSTNSIVNGYWTMTTNDFWMDYNVFAGSNRYDGTISNLVTPRMVSYMDTTTNIEFHAYLQNNSSNWPAWTDHANDNFELLSTDTAALNTGYPLTNYFTTDTLNRPRSGAWDRGPFELQTGTVTNMLVWLKFDGDYSSEYLTDYGSGTNHAWRYGRVGSTYPTNFPVQTNTSSVTGTNNGSTYCGDFRWWTNADYGLYNKDGQYAAITNVSVFTNLSQATIAAWAHYSTARRINADYDYSADGNANLISAGTSSGMLGAWNMGRANTAIWINNTRFGVVTNSNFNVPQTGDESDLVFGKAGSAVFNFPDNGFDNNGDSAVWYHYAMTFSNGVVSTYFMGTNLVTCDLSDTITNLTVGMNNNVDASTGFIGIGCNTHGGTPALEDEPGGPDYPNHGWFNGQMNDVRIYNRAFSASQMAEIYAGGQPSADAPVTPSTGRRIQATTLRVGTLR